MNVDIQLSTSQKSDRVKCIDYHPTEQWVLICLFSGKAIVFDLEKEEILNHFEPNYLPIRCGRFIARKQWVVFGSDDMNIRIYNYNTGEKVHQWKAHDDFIRGMDVHDTLPYIITCADDMLIKLWDWESDFSLVRKFDGHSYYVMAVQFNPKDPNSFASVSLDRTIKIWSLTQSRCNYSLTGHQKGINCLDYYLGSDKPYLITGSDDQTVKVWDYQTKTCIQTLKGHDDNVTSVRFHPRLPYIFSTGEDNHVILFHSGNFRKERILLQPHFDRCWSVALSPYTNKLVLGYDEGYVVYTVGKDRPPVSMDSQGRVIWSVRQEMRIGIIDEKLTDFGCGGLRGVEVSMSEKELGRCEVTPSVIRYNPNGRFLAVVGEGEYVVYTSRQLRSKAFGEGVDLVWRQGGNGYCVQINESTLRLFEDFKETRTLQLSNRITGLYGGPCLGIAYGNQTIDFYDWSSGSYLKTLCVDVQGINWNDNGLSVAIQTSSNAYILSYNQDIIESTLNNQNTQEIGVPTCFEVVEDFISNGKYGIWYKEAYMYLNNNKLMVHLHHHFTLIAYSLDHTLIDYQCAIVTQDFITANSLIPAVPAVCYDDLARFLDGQGLTEYALELARDKELRFDLYLKQGNIEECKELLQGKLSSDDRCGAYNPQRWRRLADLCITEGRVTEAQVCAHAAGDLSLSLLLLSCIGNRAGLYTLSQQAKDQDQLNIAFLALYLAGDAEACLRLLRTCGKLPEAAFFSLSHLPSHVNQTLQAWQDDLRARHHIAAELLANPKDFASYFPGLEEALELESALKPLQGLDVCASEYMKYRCMIEEGGLDLNQLKTVGREEEEEEEERQETEQEGEKEKEKEEDEFGELEGDLESEAETEDLDLDDLEKEWS